MTYETVGQALQRIREELGFSRTDVERLSNKEFRIPILALYERDMRNISVGRLLKLCEFYGIDVCDVLSPSKEAVSLRGLNGPDKEIVKQTVASFRRKNNPEKKSHAS
ncbi:MAG: helix-turn-helix transcriptional regulator [Actinomycetota bacterium]